MKKTNKQSQAKNTAGVNEHLIEGAKLLIRKIKTPAVLLDFMLEASWWIEMFDKGRKIEVDTFDTRMFIKHVVKPLLVGGDDVEEKVSKGLHEFMSDYVCEDYDGYVSKIIQAFGLEMYHSGIYFETTEYLHIIDVLLQLSQYINNYKDEKLDQKLLKVA